MFRMNGHDFSSRQIISSCIPAGDVTVPWSLIGIHAFATLAHPCASMAKSDDVQDEAKYLVNFTFSTYFTHVDACWCHTAIN